MTKVRINDLARELEVKSKPILDALEAIGVSGKTHSSSIDPDQAQRVREYFKSGGRSNGNKPAASAPPPRFNLSNVSKPGDALKAILDRKNAEAAAKNAPPPRPSRDRRRSCCLRRPSSRIVGHKTGRRGQRSANRAAGIRGNGPGSGSSPQDRDAAAPTGREHHRAAAAADSSDCQQTARGRHRRASAAWRGRRGGPSARCGRRTSGCGHPCTRST